MLSPITVKPVYQDYLRDLGGTNIAYINIKWTGGLYTEVQLN